MEVSEPRRGPSKWERRRPLVLSLAAAAIVLGATLFAFHKSRMRVRWPTPETPPPPETIARLVADLDNPRRFLLAADELKKWGRFAAPAIPTAIRRLRHGESWGASDVLAAAGAEALPALVDVLRDPNVSPYVLEETAEALIAMDDDAVRGLDREIGRAHV